MDSELYSSLRVAESKTKTNHNFQVQRLPLSNTHSLAGFIQDYPAGVWEWRCFGNGGMRS